MVKSTSQISRSRAWGSRGLDQESLNLTLDGLNLRLELASFVGSNGASNHRTSHVASTTEGGLGRDEDIRDVLAVTEISEEYV